MGTLCTPIKIYIVWTLLWIISILVVSVEAMLSIHTFHKQYVLFISVLLVILSQLICTVLIGTAMHYLSKRNIKLCWFLLATLIGVSILVFFAAPKSIEKFSFHKTEHEQHYQEEENSGHSLFHSADNLFSNSHSHIPGHEEESGHSLLHSTDNLFSNSHSHVPGHEEESGHSLLHSTDNLFSNSHSHPSSHDEEEHHHSHLSLHSVDNLFTKSHISHEHDE